MLYYGDTLDVLQALPANITQLAYVDPPFNTGRTQSIHGNSYTDYRDDYIDWLYAIMRGVKRTLTANGSVLLHLDKNEVHYAKVMMDRLFGRDQFRNEIIWAYDYGGRPKRTWPNKHDTILWYTVSDNYTFNQDASDRLPYDAPALVGPEKAVRGKLPTDVHWHTIVPTNGKERLNYPTQKPIGLLRRWIAVHSNAGDTVLEPFGGTCTASAAAKELGRDYIAMDFNMQAIEIASKRLDAQWQSL